VKYKVNKYKVNETINMDKVNKWNKYKVNKWNIKYKVNKCDKYKRIE